LLFAFVHCQLLFHTLEHANSCTSYSTVCFNLQVNNLGNQIKVLWTQAAPSTAAMTLGSLYAQPNATGVINVTGTNKTAGLADTVLSITPLQFHFHTPSEHTFNGRFSALEAHLVANVTAANTSCASNCTAVFAVLYDFSPDDVEGSTFLAPFLDAIPANATSDTSDQLGSSYTLNLTNFFPQDTTQYVQYAGSLTTPPCTEGVFWTVFTNTQPISFSQVQTLQNALAEAVMQGFIPERTDDRLPQLLNNRPIWYFGSTS